MMLRIISILAILLAWQALAIVTDPIYFVSLKQAIKALHELFWLDGLVFDVWSSLKRILWAMMLVFVIAIPLGIVIGRSKLCKLLSEPITRFLRYVPAPTLIPLAVIWFGVGELAKVFIVFWGIFFPVLLGIRDSAESVPSSFIRVSKSMGYNFWQRFRKVVFPSIAPNILNIMRVAFAEAWVYLILAEIIAAPNGIGKTLILAQRYLRVDKIFAIIILLAIIGLVSELCFYYARRKLFKYQV